MMPLLRRLDAGLPITVAAFGSSITSNNAGCFHSDVEFLRSRVDNVPLNFMLNPPRTLCAPDTFWRVGFASLFLAAVNRTWPHPHHLLLNIGMGAATLESVVDHTCLDEHTPPDVDLLMFEQYQAEKAPRTQKEPRGGVEAEKLYRQLQARRDAFMVAEAAGGNATAGAPPPQPEPIPLFLLHYLDIVPHGPDACMRDWGRDCSNSGPDVCGANFAHFASPVGSVLREEHLEVMAHYYGWSSFSVRNLVAGALRDGLHTARSFASECHFLAALFADRIHGTVLLAWMMADAMVQHLVDAAAWADAAAADAGGTPPAALRLPARPLSAGAAAPPPNRACTAAAELAVTAATHWAFHETEDALTHAAATAPGDHVAAARHAAALHTVHKPGWISDAADAALDINLTAAPGVAAAAARGATVSVNVMYLQSYSAEMAVAALACAGACACPPASLDSRCEDRVSLHMSYRLQVALSRPPGGGAPAGGANGTCLLQLRVNATAAVGGTKFKVLGLAVAF
jgi:hypothetical protein